MPTKSIEEIAAELHTIAITHGDSDEGRLAVDRLAMDHGPAAVQAAARHLEAITRR